MKTRSTAEDFLNLVLLEKSLATQYTYIIESAKKYLSGMSFGSHQKSHSNKKSDWTVSKTLTAFYLQQILSIDPIGVCQNHEISASLENLDDVCAYRKVRPLKESLSKILLVMNFMLLNKQVGKLFFFPAAFCRFEKYNNFLTSSLEPAQGTSTFLQPYSSSLHKLLKSENETGSKTPLGNGLICRHHYDKTT